MKSFSVVVLSALAIASGQAFAAPINVTAFRQVMVGDSSLSFPGAISPSAALGIFVDDVQHEFSYDYQYVGTGTGVIDPPRSAPAEAHQDSDINVATGSFDGLGSVGVIFSGQQGDGLFAKSNFEVFFDLASVHAYSLSGALMAGADGGRAESSFQLFDASNNAVISFGAISNDDVFISPVDLTKSGVLSAGSYHLVVNTFFDNCVNSWTLNNVEPPCGPNPEGFVSTGVMATNFDFTMQLREAAIPGVPEPGTIALLGIALAGLKIGRRKRRS